MTSITIDPELREHESPTGAVQRYAKEIRHSGARKAAVVGVGIGFPIASELARIGRGEGFDVELIYPHETRKA